MLPIIQISGIMYAHELFWNSFLNTHKQWTNIQQPSNNVQDELDSTENTVGRENHGVMVQLFTTHHRTSLPHPDLYFNTSLARIAEHKQHLSYLTSFY